MRQRHIDDGRVEHHHELGGGDDQRSQAEAAVAAMRPWRRVSRTPGASDCADRVVGA
jgi:hypothetical protein